MSTIRLHISYLSLISRNLISNNLIYTYLFLYVSTYICSYINLYYLYSVTLLLLSIRICTNVFLIVIESFIFSYFILFICVVFIVEHLNCRFSSFIHPSLTYYFSPYFRFLSFYISVIYIFILLIYPIY